MRNWSGGETVLLQSDTQHPHGGQNMLPLLKRHEIQVLLRAGFKVAEVAQRSQVIRYRAIAPARVAVSKS
jgi:hypothetical protein